MAFHYSICHEDKISKFVCGDTTLSGTCFMKLASRLKTDCSFNDSDNVNDKDNVNNNVNVNYNDIDSPNVNVNPISNPNPNVNVNVNPRNNKVLTRK